MIEYQIRLLEPGSSQESVNKICQVSIFDRTTSSSDSVPSIPSVNEARTPSHRPSPLPLVHETLWGTDARKPSLESPASIGSTRTPRIVGHSPYQGIYDDFGYESDREQPRYTSQPMRKNLSEATERPQPRMKEHHEDDWQVVPSNRRVRKARIGRDLGSFRPTPARATRAEVDRRSATGTVARSSERTKNRSSEAKTALSEVHSRSPPPSRRSLTENVASFWQRMPLTNTTNSQRTWANVAAGQAHHPRVQPIPPAPLPAIVPTSATPDSATNRQRNHFSSPLASEVHPEWRENGSYGVNSAHLTEKSSHEVSPRTGPTASYYATPPLGSSPSSSQPRYINNETSFQPPPILGPNPSRLPYNNIHDDISLSSKRRLPEDFRNDTQPMPYPTSAPPQLQTHSPSHSPYPPYQAYHPASALPAGYTSQPMSRDNSQQSRISTAETEPLHFPPSFTHPDNVPYPVEPPSPRDRFPDGRPLRKSPRSENAFPVSSKRTSPHNLSRSLPGIGGWIYQQDDSHPMSRSSSGAGVRIDDGYGLGLAIMGFDGHLRFGEHDPVSIEEARQRTSEYQSRLANEPMASRSRDRGRAAAYPDEAAFTGYPELNLIPTQSNPEAMRAMIGELERR